MTEGKKLVIHIWYFFVRCRAHQTRRSGNFLALFSWSRPPL